MNKLVWLIIAGILLIFLSYKLFVVYATEKSRNDYYNACIGIAEIHFADKKTNQVDFEREKTGCKVMTEDVYGPK